MYGTPAAFILRLTISFPAKLFVTTRFSTVNRFLLFFAVITT
jgi:hypothetical protein